MAELTLEDLDARLAALEAWTQMPVQHIPGYVAPEPEPTPEETPEEAPEE